MQQIFLVGDEPVPGYRLVEDQGGTAFYKLWKVQGPEGKLHQWKVIDMVVGNAAIETRTLTLLAHLQHPCLNTLTNFWQLDEGHTLILETDLPALSLRDRLNQCLAQKQPGLPLEELQRYLAQAAEGLDFLNSPRHPFQGQQVAIYHRALRPDCLLLFENKGGMECRISDFGLSKPVTEEVAQHSQGLAHYDYDPPEFFEGQTAPTSDQYALAINYYELRTGNLPFRGSMLEQLQARMNDAPSLVMLAEPERSAVRKALSRDPANRYENSTVFVQQLALYATDLAGPQAPAAVDNRPLRSMSSNRPGPLPGMAARPADPPRPAAGPLGQPSQGPFGTSNPAASRRLDAPRPGMSPSMGGGAAAGLGANYARPAPQSAPPQSFAPTGGQQPFGQAGGGKGAYPEQQRASMLPEGVSFDRANTVANRPASPDLKQLRQQLGASGPPPMPDERGEVRIPLWLVLLILIATGAVAYYAAMVMVPGATP